MAAVVIQQSQERFRKLALIADEVMQCGTSLAEDLVVSCISKNYVAKPWHTVQSYRIIWHMCDTDK
jgi:hypothetical protein